MAADRSFATEALVTTAGHYPETEVRSEMDRPSPARMYDYFLGGSHNFASDRRAAEQVLAAYPDVALVAQVNRAFLRRAVRFLAECGIDQFLDIGSGIPTAGNVHEVVHCINPAARIVYVDIDPVAVHHSLALLRDVPVASAARADARRPGEILTHPEVRALLDLRRPMAVLLLASVHFISDDAEAEASVRTLREAMAPGSYLALSHYEDTSAESARKGQQVYSTAASPLTNRSRAQLEGFFEGLELVDPGLVYAPLWRPETPTDLFLDAPARSVNLVAVGRKS